MKRLTPAQALARLSDGRRKAKGTPLVHLDTVGRSEDEVFIFGNGDGGILCPADDTLPAILGTWEEGGEMPPAMAAWLAEYASEVEWWVRVGESMQTPEGAGLIPARAPKAPRQSITPMIATKWSQTAPYNDNIVLSGKKCVTGCNATAAAQIIYYWGTRGYHRGCKATEEYTTSTNEYIVPSLPAITVFDYLDLVEKPKTDKQKAAVSQLMEYLGKTFHSDYTAKSTGAKPKDVAAYLKENVRMGGFIAYITASKLGASTFENLIYNELLQHRPVMVGGYTGTGGGHTFILDGYDAAQDLYHVNWGWGGSYNGWFKMSALDPTASRAYNSSKVAIIGIQPDYKLGDVNGDGDINVTDAMQVMQDAQQGKFSEQADINYDGQVTVTDAQIIINKILGKETL